MVDCRMIVSAFTFQAYRGTESYAVLKPLHRFVKPEQTLHRTYRYQNHRLFRSLAEMTSRCQTPLLALARP